MSIFKPKPFKELWRGWVALQVWGERQQCAGVPCRLPWAFSSGTSEGRARWGERGCSGKSRALVTGGTCGVTCQQCGFGKCWHHSS